MSKFKNVISSLQGVVSDTEHNIGHYNQLPEAFMDEYDRKKTLEDLQKLKDEYEGAIKLLEGKVEIPSTH